MKDNRDPEAIGIALLELKKQNPEKTMSQCADMLETIQTLVSATSTPQVTNAHANGNGSGHDSNNHLAT